MCVWGGGGGGVKTARCGRTCNSAWLGWGGGGDTVAGM